MTALDIVLSLKSGGEPTLDELESALLFYAEQSDDFSDRGIIAAERFEERYCVHLSPGERSIVGYFLTAKHKFVRRDALYQYLYSDRLDPPDPKILDVFVSRIKHKTGHTPLRWETVWRMGWKIEPLDCWEEISGGLLVDVSKVRWEPSDSILS